MNSIKNKFIDFNNRIEYLNREIEDIKKERIEWCKQNRKSIKELYPNKGKIYKLNDLTELKQSWGYRDLEDDIYYFKPLNVRFDPTRIFMYRSDKFPIVKGQILDVNLKKVGEYERLDTEINIFDIGEMVGRGSTHNEKPTKVYVMIDKNTGYYKIGRSINPTFREKTLQSEKPTIEMLFFNDAKIKDEKNIHQLFKSKRVRGEWFDLNGSDLLKIKEYFN